ncbi:MAG TPA: histidine kinase [Micromonosporaceae bacterium]|nr:histidine kinase [Micromonosporaceae bacterium]
MMLRRLAVDAAVVAALVLATVAYEDQWHVIARDQLEIAKMAAELGVPANFWRTELIRWMVASAVGLTAMLVRSRLPLVALAGATAMTVVHARSLVIPFMPVDVAAPIALFTVASGSVRRWVSYTALAVTFVCAFSPLLKPVKSSIQTTWGGGTFVPPTVVAFAWLFGDRSRTRRALMEQATQRARDLERERDQQAELAAAAERARIARELHDAVAHGLSIIVIQAQAAAGAMERRPATARTALSAIVATGRDSLGEMRRLLGLTRPDGPELAPLPGLGDLPTLVERVRATGLPVDLKETGQRTELPTGLALSAYRVVQEALTNALKHAGSGATVEITVHYGHDSIEVTVADTGPGAGGPPDERRGNGLRGMRERVAMLGGTLHAADREAGGFQVTARLPHPEAE